MFVVPTIVASTVALGAPAPAALPANLTPTGGRSVVVSLDGEPVVVGIIDAKRPLFGGPRRGLPSLVRQQGEAWVADALPAPDALDGGWAAAPVSDAQVVVTDMGKTVVALVAHPRRGDPLLVVCEDEGEGWVTDLLPLPAGTLRSPVLGLSGGYWHVVAHLDESDGDGWAGIVRWEEGMTEMEQWARVGSGVTAVAPVDGAAEPAVVYRVGSRVVLLDHTDQERVLGPSGHGELTAVVSGDGVMALGHDATRRTAMVRDGARRDIDGPVAGVQVASAGLDGVGLLAWTYQDNPFNTGVRIARVNAEGRSEPWVAVRAARGRGLALSVNPDGAVALLAPGSDGAPVVHQFPSMAAVQGFVVAASEDWSDQPRRWGVRALVGPVWMDRAMRTGAPGALPVADEVPLLGEVLLPAGSLGLAATADVVVGRLFAGGAFARRGAGSDGLVGEQHIVATIGLARLGVPWMSVGVQARADDVAVVPEDSADGDADGVSTRDVVGRVGLPAGAWVGPAFGYVRAPQDAYEMDDGEAVASGNTAGQFALFGVRGGWEWTDSDDWERARHLGPVASVWAGGALVPFLFEPEDDDLDDDLVGVGRAIEGSLELGVRGVMRSRKTRGAGITGQISVAIEGRLMGQRSSERDVVFQRLDRRLAPTLQVGGLY